MWKVYGKNDSEKYSIRKVEYFGGFMDRKYVVTTIKSSKPVDFQMGDYFTYRGERFTLNYIPSVSKKSSIDSTGDAFIYENIIFNSYSDELIRCEFLDYVLHDNVVHFSSLPTFGFYAASVRDLADRVQANLNRVYTGSNRWIVTVHSEFESPTGVFISINKSTIWDALSLLKTKFNANFIIRGRNITIGTAGQVIDNVFEYGKGKGLVKIEKLSQSDQQIITRLRVYGSTRNIPHRYYNKLSNASLGNYLPDNMAVHNLMLPSFPYETLDPFLDSENIGELGIMEGSVFFDGSNELLPEIYPSMEGMTAQQLRNTGITVDLDAGDNGNLDEVAVGATNTDDTPIDDNGIFDEGETVPSFKISLKDVFGNSENLADIISDGASISFKSGMCAGREFEIIGCEKSGNKYILTCNRVEDQGINLFFPYKDYPILPGDKFVLLNIEMPEVYVKAASQRLLEAGKEYLSKNDYVRYTYQVKLSPVLMARNPSLSDSLIEGDCLMFTDDDLGVDGSIIIDTLRIKEGEDAIPSYEVTLSDEKQVGAIQKMQNQIDMIISGGNRGFNEEQVKSLVNLYGSRLFLSKLSPDTAKEVITFLEGIIANGTSYFENLIASGKITAENIDVNDTLKTSILHSLVKAELQDVVLKGQLNSESFTSGFLGSGFRLNNIDGDWVLELDKIITRKALEVYELIVQKIRYQGGQVLHSPAGGKITNVTNGGNYWRVEHDSTDGFTTGAQVLCQNFKVGSEKDNPDGSSTFQGVSIKRYWRLVTSFGKGWFNLSKTDMEAGSAEPEIGDDIAVLGHRTDINQQGAIMIASAGGNTPYTAYYSGVNSYSLAGKEVARLGNLTGIVDSVFGQLAGPGLYSDNAYLRGRLEVVSGGTSVRVPADKGAWKAGTYYYYDRVTHNGSLWLCLSTSTTVEPSDSVPLIWQKQVATGTSGLSVQLSRDSYTFQESSTMRGVVAPNIQVPVEIYAMKGSTRVSVPASAITVSGLPFGMVHTVADNKVTLITGSGGGIGYLSAPASYSIIVTVDGVMFTKQFSHSIAWIGEDGEDGGDAYNLTLSKSFHLFTGTTKAATPTTVQVKILAYKGGAPLTVPMNNIFISNADLPSGMSYTKYANEVNFTITSAMMVAGTIPIYITIEGVEYMRHFSYSYAVNAGEIDRIETETKARFSVNETNIQAAVTSITSVQNIVTGLSTRVSEAEAQVLIQAGQISSKASQSDFNALGSRVTTAEQTISAHTGQISSKVSYTEYNNNNIAINDQFSQIIQRANSIELSVSNIQVGGRNLIFGGFENGRWYQSSTGGITDAQYGRTKNAINLNVGKQYTFSMAPNTSFPTGGIWFTFLKADNTFNSVLITSSLPFTFTAPSPKCTISFNAVNYTTVVGGLVFSNLKPKLEIGNKATDWTPALEDSVVGGRNYFPLSLLTVYTGYSTVKAKGEDWFELTKVNSGTGLIAAGVDSTYTVANLNKRIIVSGRFLINGQPVTMLEVLANGQQTLATNYRETEFTEINPATGFIKCIMGAGTNTYGIIHTAFGRNGVWMATGDVLRVERLMVETVEAGYSHSDYVRPLEDLTADLLATGINIVNKKITITANNTIFQNNAGQQVALFNASFTKIQAAAIELEGLVTVNSNFKVLLDGSIVANNGEFTGKISSNYDGNRIVIDAATRSLRFIRSNNELVTLMDFSDTGGYPKLVMYGSSRITSLSSQTLDMSNSSDSSNLVSINTTSFTVQKGNNMLTIGYSSGVLGNLLIDVRGLPTSTAVSGRVYLDSSGYLRVR